MKLLEILEGIDALYTSEDKWMQGGMAADADGFTAYPWDEKACKWCFVGAYLRVTGKRRLEPYDTLVLQAAITEQGYRYTAAHWNDSAEATFAELKRRLKSAIERERVREQK